MSRLLERYTVGKKIGEGAMGEVFQAYDTQTERTVAIKMLPAGSLQGHRLERFKREARTIAHLEHPFVVPLYDFSLPEKGETPFLVMRYMTGGSLADKIRQGKLPVDEVVQIARRIGSALDTAHERKLIHRDIKPGNILLDQEGYAYLADFGIVKDSSASISLTNDGQPGTAPYMSPEQIRGEKLDGRSDIYALGVVVFEMLTGQLPYQGNLNMILQGHLHEAVPSVFSHVDHLPDEVDDVLRRALAKSPKDRFSKAKHLAELLEAALQSPAAYTASRDAIADPAESEAASFDELPPTEILVDTRPSRVMSDTIKTPSSRRWQILAGVLGAGLLVILLLWGNNFINQNEAGSRTAPLEDGRTAVQEIMLEPNATTATIKSTPSDFIVVLQKADSAIWQHGDTLERIPENGRVPFDPPLFFQSSNEPVRLLLPNLVSIVMDTNTSVWIESATLDDSVLRLVQGRLLIESQLSPVRVYHEAGFEAALVAGSMGVVYDDETGQWEVDCLAGMCQLAQGELIEQFDLAEGQYSVLLSDATITTPSPARYSAYTDLDSTIPQPSSTPTFTPSPTPSATWTPTPSRTPLPTSIPGFRGPETTRLGHSVTGREIAVVRLGNGPQTLLLVGGIHGGYAPNSVQVAQEMVDYFSQNLTAVPNNVTLYIIINLNPDAPPAPGELPGRLNANGVDLNRNWDCRWEAAPLIFGTPVAGAGGTAVFSEPETQLLMSFIEDVQPEAVLFWGAGNRTQGLVSPGACHERSLVSIELVHYYGDATGHYYLNNPEILADPNLTGDVTNWLDKMSVPAIFVILPGFFEVDFERELEGVLSLLTAVSAPERLRQTPTPINCDLPVNPAWAELYDQHRTQLGCVESGVNQPMSVWQQYENGRMLWRKDTNTVYVLYDDFTTAAFVIDDPGLEGFKLSELIKGAIGYVYNTNSAVSNKLGQPTDQEREAADVTIQDFSNGFIISWRDANLQTNLIYLEQNQWQTP